MKKKNIILMVLIVAWIGVIWGHSMQPAVVSDGESGRFLVVLSKIFPFLSNDDNGMFIVRKAAHFTEYAILGVLLALEMLDFVKGWFRKLAQPAMTALLVAFTDETIQLFVQGRSGQVVDIWIDLAGATTGVLITLAIVLRYRRKKL